MPLVIISGIPCSGKTTRAEFLKSYLEEKGKKVHLINEESLLLERNKAYEDSKQEKITRATFKANVERLLTKTDTVIIDSLNYIKGFRYELFCISKASGTPHCVIQCTTEPEIAKEWNQNRVDQDTFDTELFDALVYRYETPNARQRWDKPLFEVDPDTELPIDLIEEALFSTNGPKPNMATVKESVLNTNFVYEIDKITTDIVNTLLQIQNDVNFMLGDTVTVPMSKTQVNLNRKIGMSELKRIRQQWLRMSKLNPPIPQEIGDTFVEYINTTM